MKRRTWNHVQRPSMRTQASSATQLGDARRERDRRGRLYFHEYPTKHSPSREGAGSVAFRTDAVWYRLAASVVWSRAVPRVTRDNYMLTHTSRPRPSSQAP